ncbi:MAG TPA: ArsC family reductase [Pseudomonadota bacterium]|nr:ArsC family reductase [Pseudomonadota bacterium]
MKTPVAVYGIPNCETVKRARAWLDAHGIAHSFHDFKKSGVPSDRLADWVKQLGYEVLLNRQGMTWRKLDDSVKQRITDSQSAVALMMAQPSVIKRPVIEWGSDRKVKLSVGFSVDAPAFSQVSAAANP